MQWFKHDTNASQDSKIRKLVMRYGAEGYAIYFHCLELIAGDVSESNITFELEHDAEIIADNLKIKGTANESAIDRVNKIMRGIIELGLFEESHGRIFCFKLLKRMDTSMTSSKRFRALISKAKEKNHDAVMINHDNVMQEEKRIEEKRIEENRIEINKPSSLESKILHVNYNIIYSYFKQYCSSLHELKGNPTDKRKNLIRKLIKDGYTYDDFETVFKIAGSNKFLSGDNDAGWRADFNWLLKPDKFLKILEGGYNHESKANREKRAREAEWEEYMKGLDERERQRSKEASNAS